MANGQDCGEDLFFERLAAKSRPTGRASARLKSQIYSALMRRAAEVGPLRSLTAVRAAGHRLCVFERSVQVLPLGSKLESLNYCRICHARLLAERLARAPLFWSGCPYAEFHKS